MENVFYIVVLVFDFISLRIYNYVENGEDFEYGDFFLNRLLGGIFIWEGIW